MAPASPESCYPRGVEGRVFGVLPQLDVLTCKCGGDGGLEAAVSCRD